MVIGIGIFQKIGVDVELGIEVKALQIQHFRQGDFPEMHSFLGRTRIHVLDAVLQRVQLLRRYQVRFTDENLIRKPDLTACFLAVIQLLLPVLGIHQGDDGIEQERFSDFIVHEKGLRHGAGVGQTRGFDDDALKVQQPFALFGRQHLQGGTQIFPNGAADAAIAHLNDLLLGFAHQNIGIDIFFAEFIFNHRDFLTVGFTQNPLEQGGFARA